MARQSNLPPSVVCLVTVHRGQTVEELIEEIASRLGKQPSMLLEAAAIDDDDRTLIHGMMWERLGIASANYAQPLYRAARAMVIDHREDREANVARVLAAENSKLPKRLGKALPVADPLDTVPAEVTAAEQAELDALGAEMERQVATLAARQREVRLRMAAKKDAWLAGQRVAS